VKRLTSGLAANAGGAADQTSRTTPIPEGWVGDFADAGFGADG